MLSRKQLLVTAIAMITGSFLFNLLWIVNKCYVEGKKSTPLSIICIYLLVVFAGLAVIAKQHQLRSTTSISLFNCVATFNLCASITGSVFMYFYSGSQISVKFIPLLIPFFIGVLIFERVFFSIKHQHRIS